MSRFTKATLFIAGLALAVAAEAALISGLFAERDGFFIGGEWLVPAVGVAAWVLVNEMKKLYKEIQRREKRYENTAYQHISACSAFR